MQALLRLSVPLALLMLGGCAAVPAKRDPRDPWERLNRTTYAFNDRLDRNVAKPVAKAYQKVTPTFVRTGVSNFFDNLNTTTVIVNDLLTLQVTHFFSDTGRFLLNSTLGIGGFLDPASAAGLQRHPGDFGMTLGKWGLGTGPYLVLPILGPSDVRDAVGRAADTYTVVTPYVLDTWPSVGEWTASAIDTRYRLLAAESLLQNSYDRYAFMRNAYLQQRDFLVSGKTGEKSDAEEENEKLLEELDKEDQQGSPPPATQPPAPQPQATTPQPTPQPQAAPGAQPQAVPPPR